MRRAEAACDDAAEAKSEARSLAEALDGSRGRVLAERSDYEAALARLTHEHKQEIEKADSKARYLFARLGEFERGAKEKQQQPQSSPRRRAKEQLSPRGPTLAQHTNNTRGNTRGASPVRTRPSVPSDRSASGVMMEGNHPLSAVAAAYANPGPGWSTKPQASALTPGSRSRGLDEVSSPHPHSHSHSIHSSSPHVRRPPSSSSPNAQRHGREVLTREVLTAPVTASSSATAAKRSAPAHGAATTSPLRTR